MCKVWSAQSKDQRNKVKWKQVRAAFSGTASQIIYTAYYLAVWPISNA